MPPPFNLLVGAAQAALQIGITKEQIAKIDALEHGGITQGEQIVRVGEKNKREAILPLQDARAKQLLKGIGGGGDVTIENINVTNVIEGGVNADNIDEILIRITEATEQGTVNALKMAQEIFSHGKEREELA